MGASRDNGRLALENRTVKRRLRVTKPYRLIVWGPGEIGGNVVRAVHRRPDLQIVGAKAFSPHKHGRDLGELFGIGPIGVNATTSRDEILALDADCVILTPDARSIADGLDDDVIALLESGKNVIATVAYHNVTMTDSFAASRASAARLHAACLKGGSSLLGTDIHPSFMVECLALTMARAQTKTTHIRIVEALDFSGAPAGMWGGLEHLGFGRDPAELDTSSFIARFADLYYPKIAGNVGYALYGAETKDIRIESDIRGLPSLTDFEVQSVKIKEGNDGGAAPDPPWPSGRGPLLHQ
jgi:2,4-diaminopentanoate dehydrogenase